VQMEFKEYMAIFYKWLDETRQDMKEMRREHEERMRNLEEQNERLIDTQSLMGRLLLRMNDTQDKHDGKLDDHDDRLSRAGI